MKNVRHIKVKRFLLYGLIINLIVGLVSCCKNEEFYSKIKSNDDCIISCEIIYDKKPPIIVVMKKTEFIYRIKKYNLLVDDEFLIKVIKSKEPYLIKSKMLYNEFLGFQIVEQPRVDSLINLGINNFLIKNNINKLLLNPKFIENTTEMEELYAIRKLFEARILFKQDCESGYYLVID